MQENIKSSFFIKVIFSFLDDKTKLKLLKCNKRLQDYLDINLLSYRRLSGRYIEYGEKGNIKEYSSINDILIFEGEYLNGKRNGKGKEYDKYNGRLTYEGEYLNGKRNGKGKEYYNNQIIFDGEYLNGKKWNGKGYDTKNNIIYELKNGEGYVKELNMIGLIKFEGEYSNGERNGKGKEYDYGGDLEFEGEYKNGKRDGIGKEYNKGNITFEGKYLNGKRWNGKGYDNKNNIINELKNGSGLIRIYDKLGNLKTEENYINGKLNGKRKDYFNGKLFVEFEYINGISNKGKEFNLNKGELKFEGEYLYGWRLKGKTYIKGKLEFEGEYLFNKKYNGKGYDENGNIIYELINGNGKVKEYDDYERLEFDGEYLNGRRWNGIYKLYNFDNTILRQEEYKNGKKNILK